MKHFKLLGIPSIHYLRLLFLFCFVFFLLNCWIRWCSAIYNKKFRIFSRFNLQKINFLFYVSFSGNHSIFTKTATKWSCAKNTVTVLGSTPFKPGSWITVHMFRFWLQTCSLIYTSGYFDNILPYVSEIWTSLIWYGFGLWPNKYCSLQLWWNMSATFSLISWYIWEMDHQLSLKD